MSSIRIDYITSHEVDTARWNACIQQSDNGLIYAEKLYLDLMADQWNAIVINDYAAVMPLPWRKKFGQPYYYHVPFVPQSGLIGHVDPGDFGLIVKTIFKKIKAGDLFLNFGNEALAKYLTARRLINLVLDLTPDYASISGRYHKDLLKNLKKSAKQKQVYLPDNDVRNAVSLFVKYYGGDIASLRESDYERFAGLCIQLFHQGKALVRKVTDTKGRLLAIALLLKDGRRLYNMMNTVLAEGRSRSSNHFLFDNIVKEFAGSGLVLDFEGSEISGIRKFYLNFGSVEQPYYWYSRFSLAARLLKKFV